MAAQRVYFQCTYIEQAVATIHTQRNASIQPISQYILGNTVNHVSTTYDIKLFSNVLWYLKRPAQTE